MRSKRLGRYRPTRGQRIRYHPTRQEVQDALALIPKIVEGKMATFEYAKNGMHSLKPDFLKWEEVGAEVLGKIVGRSYVQLKEGASPKYTVETEDGRVSFLAPIQIAEALDMVPVGTMIRIKYLGQVGRMKDFEIESEDFSPAELFGTGGSA